MTKIWCICKTTKCTTYPWSLSFGEVCNYPIQRNHLFIECAIFCPFCTLYWGFVLIIRGFWCQIKFTVLLLVNLLNVFLLLSPNSILFLLLIVVRCHLALAGSFWFLVSLSRPFFICSRFSECT